MGGTATKQEVQNGDVGALDMSQNESVEYAFVNLHLETLGSVAMMIGVLVALGLVYKAYRMKTHPARELRRRAQLAGTCMVEMKELPKGMDFTGPKAVFPR